MSKRLGSRYRSGRSPDWLKFKNPEAPARCRREAEEDLGEANMSTRCLVGIIAAAVVTTMFVAPADARPKKQKRPTAVQTQQAPSLDGRTLGRMRTCGFDYLQYDGMGTPSGPYCH